MFGPQATRIPKYNHIPKKFYVSKTRPAVVKILKRLFGLTNRALMVYNFSFTLQHLRMPARFDAFPVLSHLRSVDRTLIIGILTPSKCVLFYMRTTPTPRMLGLKILVRQKTRLQLY